MTSGSEGQDTRVGKEPGLERALNRYVGNAIHLFLTGLALLVFAAAGIATVGVLRFEFPRLWQTTDEYNALQLFIQSILLVAIAAELALLLTFHRTRAAIEVIIFVIARKLLSPEITALDLLTGAAALALLLAARYYWTPRRKDKHAS